MVSKTKIETASLTIPSPNKIAFNYGKSFSLRIDKAATVSVAHSTAASTRHSTLDSF